RLAGARLGLLELPDDLAEQVTSRPAGVRALSVVEWDSLEVGVEVDLPLGNEGKGCDARDEAGLAHPVGSHSNEAVEVPPNEVHKHGLGEVVEVETEHERVRPDLSGRAVEKLTAPNTAERARNGAGELRRSAVGRGTDRLLGGDDAVLDTQRPRQRSGRLEGRGPVAGDALVDAHGHQADGRAPAEVPLGESEGDPAVLPA